MTLVASVDDFLRSIWPRLPSKLNNKSKEVFEVLKQRGFYDSKKARWTAFEHDPADSKEHETRAYAPLATVFQQIVDAGQHVARNELEQNFNFVVHGNTSLDSERREDSRPDAFSEILDTPMRRMNERLKSLKRDEKERAAKGKLTACVLQEFKKLKNVRSTDDDIKKLLWNANRVLALDPCRRFVLGTTIENISLRLWMLNRGTLLKSEEVDLMKDGLSLVHIFLSIAFSSAFSHTDSRRQYNILIDNKVYTTTETLCDRSAKNPFGRGVRVWKVQDTKNQIRVLKDLWVETTRRTEDEIYNRILEDVDRYTENREDGPQLQALVRECLFKPIASGRVQIEGEDDDTETKILRGYDTSNATSVPLLSPPKPAPMSSQSFGLSTPDDPDRDALCESQPEDQDEDEDEDKDKAEDEESSEANTNDDQEKRFDILNTQRCHYRIMFEQYAITLQNEPNLGNVLFAMIKVISALQVIHGAGWVHRDISSGNLYYCEERNTGIIGDLEYAKFKTDHVGHPGTPSFMACEAIMNTYGFYPYSYTPDPNTPRPAFLYNPLHDLEFIWWILVWILFFNDGDTRSPNSKGDSRSPNPDLRQAQMNRLFNGKLENNARMPFFRLPDLQGFLSDSFQFLLPTVMQFAQLLTKAYCEVEMSFPTLTFDIKTYKTVHSDCVTALKLVLQHASSVQLTSVKKRAQEASPVAGRKRRAILPQKKSRKKSK
ncbi:hypothetical protein GYMLUDRAFT_260994 [Collybiopsis luxurians FD-317 M1]|uniref:Fungal-type protein kinase domain-containing protein n=1 Tax=Collybiopsis luxurians FD-317 M1 TaxID=944289 RepID=A0A0D0BYX8_9AGAR|nr:hypothetical protein GYMLUDRAFT_260994 [Collybiopsis luxurians FD-317 M1]